MLNKYVYDDSDDKDYNNARPSIFKKKTVVCDTRVPFNVSQ